MKKPRVCLLIILLLCPGLSLFAEADMTRLKALGFQVPEKRSAAPGLQTADADGIETLLPQTGTVTLINFWASWCPPCRAEMPSLQRLYSTLKEEGFELAAVNLNEEKPYVEDFLKREAPALPVYYFPEEEALGAYKFSGIPVSYLIDREGRVAAVLTGSMEWDSPLIIRTIRELLHE